MIIISVDYIFIGGSGSVFCMVAHWAERDLGLFILDVLPEIDGWARIYSNPSVFLDRSPFQAADLAGLLEFGEREALTSCRKHATSCREYRLCPDRVCGGIGVQPAQVCSAEQICPLTQSNYFPNSLSFSFFFYHSFCFIGTYVTARTRALVKCLQEIRSHRSLQGTTLRQIR